MRQRIQLILSNMIDHIFWLTQVNAKFKDFKNSVFLSTPRVIMKYQNGNYLPVVPGPWPQLTQKWTAVAMIYL